MNTRMIHQIENQFDELQNYNLYRTDPVLQEILMRYGSQDQALLAELGGKVGTTQAYLWADQANRHTPELHAFDARGRRIDNLEFQNKLDGIISECVIASLENKMEIINKIHSFLKCGGFFIINDITALVKKAAGNFFTFNDWIETLNKAGFEIIYYEDNTSALKEFYLKALWENQSCCIADCIPKGYKGTETGYFSIIAKKI